MSHPFLLVDELIVALTLTADRFFVNIFHPFDLMLMIFALKIEERQQNFDWHDILAPVLRSFALN